MRVTHVHQIVPYFKMCYRIVFFIFTIIHMRITSALPAAVLSMLACNICVAQSAQTVTDPRLEQLSKTAPEKLVNEDSYSIQWPLIHEREIGWSRRNWSELHLSDPANAQLKSVGPKKEDLAKALLRAAFEGRIKIYAADDDRFTKELSTDALNDLLKKIPEGTSTVSVEKLLLKEDWMYVKSNQQLCDRIIGIAPVRQIVGSDGVTTEQTLFWIYYPSAREVLRELTLNNPSKEVFKNVDELLEMRQFQEQVINTKEFRREVYEGHATPYSEGAPVKYK